MQSSVSAGRMSVHPSVYPSVTRWHGVKTTQARIMKSSPTASPRTLVLDKKLSTNSKGFTLSEGGKWEWVRKYSQLAANKYSPGALGHVGAN